MNSFTEEAGSAEFGDPVLTPMSVSEKPPSSSHGSKEVNPYTSAPMGKKAAKKQGAKSTKHGSNANVIDAKKFLKKDHHDSNMVVAVRIRPLSNKEILAKDFEVVQPQDKLILVLDKVDVECEREDKKPDVLHRSREQRYFFDRIFS